MNANNFLVLISGDILGDVDMCSVFGLISSILFSCLPAGSSWRWYDLRWRVNKAVSDLQGVEPAVLLSVKRQNSWRRRQSRRHVRDLDSHNVGAMFIRRVHAAYRRLGAVIWECF